MARADVYVLATTPFAAAEILGRTPALAAREQSLFGPLTRGGPHTQVSFRVAFSEPIAWPRRRTALVIADSEFNLTLFAQEQAWAGSVPLGEGVRSLWTGTACVATVPGRLHGLPLAQCTKGQFVEEVLAQLGRCGALDALLREANGGRGWGSFPVVRVEVWHEWLFSPGGIRPPQPKWVNTTDTQAYQPTQATPVPNLVLAGAHPDRGRRVEHRGGRGERAACGPGHRAGGRGGPPVQAAVAAGPSARSMMPASRSAPHTSWISSWSGCAIALLGVIALALGR